jgi:hypothetical protein
MLNFGLARWAIGRIYMIGRDDARDNERMHVSSYEELLVPLPVEIIFYSSCALPAPYRLVLPR